MFLFSFLFFPIAIFFYLFNLKSNPQKKMQFKNNILIIFFGFICGVIYDIILEFFIFSSNYSGINYFKYTFSDFAFLMLTPLCFYLLFFVWSKDSVQKKIEGFKFFLIPFYTVYIPFYVLHLEMENSFFVLFIIPVIVFFDILLLQKDLYSIANNSKKSKIVLMIFAFIFETFIPSILRTIWHFNFLFGFWWIFVVLSTIYFIFRFKNEIKLFFTQIVPAESKNSL